MAYILIVDDEKNLRWSLRLALEEQGQRVEDVNSGEECLESLRKERERERRRHKSPHVPKTGGN